jgi:DNA invertase Pin-like site-specific DNA recombinase
MTVANHPKIHAHHLRRKALVYVRQSTLHQVFAHGESTARQYGLTTTVQDLGWPDALVEVIDDDLGQSGSSATHRHGFQRLVAGVALGQVGIVMGLEISRLARNNADFQQLLQICGLNQTLIGDADAIYDLTQLLCGAQSYVAAKLENRLVTKFSRDERHITICTIASK